MLLSLYVQNFRSILELKVDFAYGEGKAPNGHSESEIMPFIEGPGKRRVVPCLAFFGANASGKTNILNAFGTLKLLAYREAPLSERFEPNRINPKFDKTTLAAEFLVGSDCFDYRITYSADSVDAESLHKNGEVIYSIRQLAPTFSTELLSPAYPQEKLADIIRVECSDGGGQQTKPFLRVMGHGYSGLHVDLRRAFVFFKEAAKYWPNQGPLSLPYVVHNLASALGIDERAAVLEITNVVSRLDVGIEAIEILKHEIASVESTSGEDDESEERISMPKFAIQITTTHLDVFGKSAVFDFTRHESAGTQRLAGLVGLILHALRTGGVLLVDELECSLHPLLMRELVLLFKKRRHNPKGAQLIFTTHNTDILDDSILRISEIALVRKTAANGTLVRRLVDARKEGEDIRNVTNFRKQYLAGYYAGVPHPAL